MMTAETNERPRRYHATSVPVTVELDSRIWWALSNFAEKHNMTVAVVLAELGQKLITREPAVESRAGAATRGTTRPTYSRTEMDAKVALLYGQSLSDAAMARRIGCSAETVRQVRVRLKLPALGEYGKGRRAS